MTIWCVNTFPELRHGSVESASQKSAKKPCSGTKQHTMIPPICGILLNPAGIISGDAGGNITRSIRSPPTCCSKPPGATVHPLSLSFPNFRMTKASSCPPQGVCLISNQQIPFRSKRLSLLHPSSAVLPPVRCPSVPSARKPMKPWPLR